MPFPSCKLTKQKVHVSNEETTLRLEYEIIHSSELTRFDVCLRVSAKGDKNFYFRADIVGSQMQTRQFDPEECHKKRERLVRSYFHGLGINCHRIETDIEFITKNVDQALRFIQGVRRIAQFDSGQFNQLTAYISTSMLPFELAFEKIERLVQEGKSQEAFEKAQLVDNLGYAKAFLKLGYLFKDAGYQQPAYVSFINVAKESPYYQFAQLEAAQLAPFALTGGMGQVMKQVFTHCAAAKEGQANFQTLYMLGGVLKPRNKTIQEQQKQIERLQKEVNKGKEAGVHWMAPNKAASGVKETSTGLDVALLTGKDKTKFSKRM